MKNNLCYKCGAVATSKEHVPPRCLFPDYKDTGTNLYRKNLLTVPSCNVHNSQKTNDDEFLMISLAGIIGNNVVGFMHNQSKVRRALDKKGNDFIKRVVIRAKPHVIESKSGVRFHVLQGSADYHRLVKCIEHIAYGLYFLQYNEVFKGKCNMLLGFINYYNDHTEKMKVWCREMYQHQGKSWDMKGSVPEVFKYQFGPVDQHGLIPLCMTFYDGAQVYVSFHREGVPEPFDLGGELMKSGVKTIVRIDDDNFLEFN